MIKVHDQCLRLIELKSPPKRIISLVPSQTELLADLGLGKDVVGITKYCVHPASWLVEKQVIGGTKQIDIELIHHLQPDLILANKEENVKEQVNALQAHFPVFISDVHNLETALEMIALVGKITARANQASSLSAAIAELFKSVIISRPLKVLYFIWRKPWMTVGCDTFIHDMLSRMGLVNVVAETKRYPQLTNEGISSMNPDLIFLSSEPYPFKEKHIDELRELVPSARIMLVDGEMFSWYGSRLLKAPHYFNTLTARIG